MNYLFLGDIFHRRFSPKMNSFRYSVAYLNFPLSALHTMRSTFFSVDRFNLFSFYNKDHYGYKGGDGDLENWAKEQFQLNGVTVRSVSLQTFPRVFGFVFNPVSFWFGYNNQVELVGVLAEVNNTFGGRHLYTINKNGDPITHTDVFTLEKNFHVSPFNDIEGEYRFQFEITEKVVSKVVIKYFTEGRELLHTEIKGRPSPLKSIPLLKIFFKIPFLTFKVVLLIHYQAVKLFLKGVPFIGAVPKKGK